VIQNTRIRRISERQAEGKVKALLITAALNTPAALLVLLVLLVLTGCGSRATGFCPYGSQGGTAAG